MRSWLTQGLAVARRCTIRCLIIPRIIWYQFTKLEEMEGLIGLGGTLRTWNLVHTTVGASFDCAKSLEPSQ